MITEIFILKKLLFLNFSILLILGANAQKQANYWYFGSGVGLNFNQTPPQILNNNFANSQEGCASIADNNGNLLFYTNGLTIINRKHEVMLNGNGIRGDLSSTSNTIIIPLPGNDSIYYLFTVGATTQVAKGFRYTIINIKGDGGFGEVLQKNVYVEEAYEKLAAVRHCNKKDVWITIRKWESDEFNTYLLTASGFNVNPVVSNTGFVVGGLANNAIGSLKFSIDGSKLAAVHATETDAVELMRFNNATGQITNPVIIRPNILPHALSFTGVYGAEFSPNGNLLYISSNNSVTDPCILYQFDITSFNQATIIATKQIIAAPKPWFAGALQTGPDMKIYLAAWKDTAVSVIENPDVYGAGCNFVFNKISFGNRPEPVQFGLPSFVQSDLSTSFIPFDFTRSGKCTDVDVQFNINRTTGIDSVKWSFGDGQQSASFAPLHRYSTTGFFTVSLIIFKLDCSGLNDTINKEIWIMPTLSLLGNDIDACGFKDVSLAVNVNVPGINYLWNTGSTADKIAVTSPGQYWVQLAYKGCTISDTINITVKPAPVVNIGNDTTVCLSAGVLLSAGNSAAGNTYLWSTGQTINSIAVNKPGSYSVTLTQNNCVASDTVNVVWGDCPFYIPNAFTPNNDGVNDKFGIINGFSVQDFSMKIFNRYGQVIFTTNNRAEKWDGTFKGKVIPGGNYPWSVIYINAQGYTKWLKGSVLIIH